MKQGIDISNYEEFVMDYLESNLDQARMAEFEAFLLTCPEIAVELEDLESSDFVVVPKTEAFNKEEIKLELSEVMGINSSNYEEAFALSVDPELDPELSSSVSAFVSANPFLVKDLQAYQHTKLSPDQSVVFNAKASLKQPIPIWESRPFYVSLRVAAAITILFGVGTLLRFQQSETYDPRVAMRQYSDMNVKSLNSMTTAEASSQSTLIAENESSHSVDVADIIPLMATVSEVSSKWKPLVIKDRTQPSLTMVLPTQHEAVASTHNPDRAAELSLAQFLGKEFLGVRPEKASSTKDLLKESAKKVIEQNDQIALNTSIEDDQRKTFSLMAGAVEFKRVTYKAN